MIPVPGLDTIRFDQLVEEGRGLIPRFAPDWTDHNLHDPGITLLDLLAWLVDQQVYRIGFVGDSHLRAFAALLGVQPQGAKPARGLVWPAGVATEQSLPAGARAWPVSQPELIFSLAENMRLSDATLKKLTAHGARGTSAVKADSSGTLRLDPATDWLELGLSGPIFSESETAQTLSIGLEFAEPLPDLGETVPVPIAFDYRASDGSWHRADIVWRDGGGRRSGVALLTIPPGVGPASALRLDFTGRSSPVRALPTRVALNVVPVVQLETLPGIGIGDGLGLPDLELPFGAEALPGDGSARHPLAIRTLEAGAVVEWTQVADLSRSGPDDCHFVLDEALDAIRFGNGVNGRMPPAETQIDRGTLDLTAGAAGNLAAGLEWSVEGIEATRTFGTNREPLSGGSDAWDRDVLLTELRRGSQKRMAMLTDAELREAAASLQGFGLERSEVLARFLPTLPHRAVPGARTLLLHRREGTEGSDLWIDTIERALANRRVLGERLALAAAEPVAIAVTAEILIEAGSDEPTIRAAVMTALEARLSPFRKSKAIAPWPSGRPVTIGELEALIAAVEGVVAVPRLRVGGRGEQAEQVSVPLARTEVAAVDSIVLDLRVER